MINLAGPESYQHPSGRNFRGAIFVILLAVIGISGYLWFQNNAKNSTAGSQTSTASQSSPTPTTPAPSPEPVEPDIAQLQAVINKTIAANPNVTVGVAVIDLTNTKSTTAGSAKTFTAASTTKVITAVCFLQQVEAGRLSLNQPLGSSTAKYELQQMINLSNNDSWHLLINLVGGYAKVESCGHLLGASSFDFTYNNIITPADDAQLLAELYQGKLLNRTNTDLLLSLMQDTNREDLLGSLVSPKVTVYHKYGELYDGDDNAIYLLHDTGLLTVNNHTLVVSIYTSSVGTASKVVVTEIQEIGSEALSYLEQVR